jgi:hypothetical protein
VAIWRIRMSVSCRILSHVIKYLTDIIRVCERAEFEGYCRMVRLLDLAVNCQYVVFPLRRVDTKL